MEKFSLEIGDLELKFSPKNLIVPIPKSADGRHLTVYWQVNDSGLYTPHVTFPSAPRDRQRRTIGRFAPSDVRQMLESFRRELCTLALAAMQRTTLERLHEGGWLVLGVGPKIEERLEKWFLPSPNRIVMPTDLEDLLDVAEVLIEHALSPLELPSAGLSKPIQLCRAYGDTLQMAWAAYGKYDLASERGWHIATAESFGEQVFRAAVMKCLSDQAVRALLNLQRHVGTKPSEPLMVLARDRGILKH
jgi:hypothetical protein